MVKYIDNDLKDKKNLNSNNDYPFYYSIKDGIIANKVCKANGDRINTYFGYIKESDNDEKINTRKNNIKQLLNTDKNISFQPNEKHV
ncbi:MAG: hypothetical protein K6E76_02330 [Patescibacteria group bacterium]|nr:hypothetical protein [Patescibacteria group bacterium]